MSKPLSEEWIARQLELCEKAKPKRLWQMYKAYEVTDFIAAAREGYPLVLQALKDCQDTVREMMRGFDPARKKERDASTE